MAKGRRDIEVFSLSFLDAICCGFGAVIMLLVLNKASEPRIIEQVKTERRGLIAALQQELAEIRGETQAIDRDMTSVEQQIEDAKVLLARLQGELSKLRGKFAASKEEGLDSDLRGELMATRQQLTEDMRRLLADYKPPPEDTTVGGIPVDSEYIIFVIDSSGSMRNFAWSVALKKVNEALDVYPKVKGIQVMNDDGRYVLPGYEGKWIPDSPASRRAIRRALANFDKFSDSNPTDGLLKAFNTYYEPGRKMSIYYFGDDFAGDRQVEPVVREIERINGGGKPGEQLVRFHAVGFPVQFVVGNPRGAVRFANFMRALCERNGGTFIAVTEISEAPRIEIRVPGFPR